MLQKSGIQQTLSFFGCLKICMLDPKLQGYGGGFKELGSTENWKGNEISISTVDVP